MTKQRACDDLTALIERVPGLLAQKSFSEDFKQWKSEAAAALKHTFPKEPGYLKDWNNISYSLGMWSNYTPDSAFEEAFQDGLRSARAFLNARLEEVNRYWGSVQDEPSSAEKPQDPQTVFVVHGRQKLGDLHNFLRALGLTPLEWSQARKLTGIPTPYTWQVVDCALQLAGAIVVLMTPDDEARLREDLWGDHENALEKEFLKQPRQNVLFEAGVAYGRSPERTVLLRIGSQRPMSDLAGHHVLQLTNDPASRQQVADALANAGCPVNTTGTDWFRAGDFA